jgi:hypothetical protein
MSNTADRTSEILEQHEDGMMFVCTNDTFDECMSLQLLGLPFAQMKTVKALQPEKSALFLFNMSDRKLHGLFYAKGEGDQNINRGAWSKGKSGSSPFPAQIEFVIARECEALHEKDFRHVFPDKHRIRKLDKLEVRKLVKLFLRDSSPAGTKKLVNTKPLVRHYTQAEQQQLQLQKQQLKEPVQPLTASVPATKAFEWAVPPPKFSWGKAAPKVAEPVPVVAAPVPGLASVGPSVVGMNGGGMPQAAPPQLQGAWGAGAPQPQVQPQLVPPQAFTPRSQHSVASSDGSSAGSGHGSVNGDDNEEVQVQSGWGLPSSSLANNMVGLEQQWTSAMRVSAGGAVGSEQAPPPAWDAWAQQDDGNSWHASQPQQHNQQDSWSGQPWTPQQQNQQAHLTSQPQVARYQAYKGPADAVATGAGMRPPPGFAATRKAPPGMEQFNQQQGMQMQGGMRMGPPQGYFQPQAQFDGNMASLEQQQHHQHHQQQQQQQQQGGSGLDGVKTIKELFERVGLEKYIGQFEAEQMDLETLLLCDEKHLEEMHIALGARVKLANVIAHLREERKRA